MSERKTTTVTVFDEEQYDGNWMPENLTEAIEWLQGIVNEIPGEHRSTAKIEIDSTSRYDSCYATIAISYRRPETDEEVAARQRNQKLAAEQQKQRDMATIAALKAKYETPKA